MPPPGGPPLYQASGVPSRSSKERWSRSSADARICAHARCRRRRGSRRGSLRLPMFGGPPVGARLPAFGGDRRHSVDRPVGLPHSVDACRRPPRVRWRPARRDDAAEIRRHSVEDRPARPSSDSVDRPRRSHSAPAPGGAQGVNPLGGTMVAGGQIGVW
jgi:hypothetical protein